MGRTALGFWAGGLLYLGFALLLIWAAGDIPRDTTTIIALGVMLFAGGLFIGMGINEHRHYRVISPRRKQRAQSSKWD